jgi:hypothetical protein
VRCDWGLLDIASDIIVVADLWIWEGLGEAFPTGGGRQPVTLPVMDHHVMVFGDSWYSPRSFKAPSKASVIDPAESYRLGGGLANQAAAEDTGLGFGLPLDPPEEWPRDPRYARDVDPLGVLVN